MSRDLQQQRDNDNETKSAADVDVDAEHKPEVSRKASNAGLRREVQMKAGSANADPAQVHAAAQEGTATGGAPVPHLDTIQRAFGNHDISNVQAHVGGAATSATAAMGAQAYATGNRVAFGQQPDLHTAAHEVAHVVQQRNGVALSGGVGAAGDAYEKNADTVADKVVAGQSVEHLLGPAKPATTAAAPAVQKKPADKAPDPKAAHDTSDRKSFNSAQSGLTYLAKELHTWAPQLSKLASSDTSTEAGAGPGMNAITAIFERAQADVSHVNDMILVASKSERNLLASEVKLVQGAFAKFTIPAQQASHFMTTNHADALPLQALHKTIDGFTAQIGLEGTELTPDRTVPEGDEKALSKSMIDDQITGIGAALDSVKAGNDADAGRVIMHTRYLDLVSKEHLAEIKTHKPQLKAFLKELGEIQQSKPAMVDRLSEAHGHLTSLVK